MLPKIFCDTFYTHAMACQNKTGISAIATLAQAAVESAWGSAAPGYCFFGEKDTNGVNGDEQLLATTEYSRRADLKFPVIISVTPVIRNGQKWYRYKIKDYFRKYDTPEAAFIDHCNFFLTNQSYSEALEVKADTDKFIDAIAKAGYATDPNYADTLKRVARMIEKNI